LQQFSKSSFDFYFISWFTDSAPPYVPHLHLGS
jgi:hypothetical protein